MITIVQQFECEIYEIINITELTTLVNIDAKLILRKKLTILIAGICSHRRRNKEVQTNQELLGVADPNRSTTIWDWIVEKGIWENVISVTYGVTEYEKVKYSTYWKRL